MSNFIRKIEISVYGEREKNLVAGSGDSKPDVILTSNGAPSQLRISCAIQKSNVSIPNSTVILVYNLSESTRSLLCQRGLAVKIMAGYENGIMSQYFRGSIMAGYSERQGPDIVTRLICLTGGETLATKLCQFESVAPNTGLEFLVSTLAQTFDGVLYSPDMVKVADILVDKGGWTFKGTVRQFLDKLAHQYHFSWTIDDGVFMAIDHGETVGQITFVNSTDGKLINVSPMLTGIMQVQNGVKIKTSLIPDMVPNSPISVKSAINKSLNQVYKINTVDIKIDTYTAEWTMDMQVIFQDAQTVKVNG